VYRTSLVSWLTGITTPAAAAASPAAAPELAKEKDALTLPADVVTRLKVRTEPAQPSIVPSALELSGSLILDSDRLAHVHARFPGEVVELGKTNNPGAPGQPVAFGQHVHKGQLLAVIWSHDLGEKKSDLIDALSQLRVDEDSLERITKAAAEGSVPDRVLHDTERKVEADRIAISRAERTLQSWRISKEEIDSVRAEAERLAHEKTAKREEVVAQWAKLEVLSPLDGTVIERNVALGELVDTSTDLFKIADLSRLGVLAYAYEEDLPTLDRLPASQRVWSVTVPGAPGRIGRFDQVGCIIDPNQHTALVMGWVDNPDGKLRVGQFVTTRLEIPPPQGEVVVPAAALCEESDRTYVFVQADGKATYARRGVSVTRRSGDKAYVRSRPTPEESRRGLAPLAAGEKVVVSRVVELAASLDSLQQNSGTP